MQIGSCVGCRVVVLFVVWCRRLVGYLLGYDCSEELLHDIFNPAFRQVGPQSTREGLARDKEAPL